MKRSDQLLQRVTAISVAVLSFVAVVVALSFDSNSALGYDVTYPTLAVSFLGLAALGAIVIVKQVAHRIGWVLLVTGLGGTLSVFGEKMTLVSALRSWSGDVASGLLSMAGIAFATMMAGIALLFLLFPNGKLASRPWRIAAGMAVGGWVIQVAASPLVAPYVTDPEAFLRSNWDYAEAGQTIPSWITNLTDIGTFVGLAAIVLGAISLGVRLRTSRGVEHQQVKWVVYSGAAAAVGWFIALAVPLGAAIEVVPAGIGTIALTTGLAMSLFRYRLYDIDRFISRTVGYVVVVGLLGLIYAAGAVWLPSRIAGDSPLFVAGSTLVVAALFTPFRRRALEAVDRRFYRSRYDAQLVIEDFSDRLRDQIDLDKLTDGLVDVVNETMQPSAVGMWVREP